MDEALEAMAEIYEAVLAHDAETLRKVLLRVDDELHRMRAETEVDSLITPDLEDR